MKKSDMIIRLILVAVSVVLIITLWADYRSLCTELSDTEDLLEASRSTWQGISEEKEALQEELTQAKSDLREAELTLEETGPQREKLIAEINQLKLDIEALKSQGAAGD